MVQFDGLSYRTLSALVWRDWLQNGHTFFWCLTLEEDLMDNASTEKTKEETCHTVTQVKNYWMNRSVSIQSLNYFSLHYKKKTHEIYLLIVCKWNKGRWLFNKRSSRICYKIKFDFYEVFIFLIT